MLEAEGDRTATPEKTDHLIRVLLKVLRKGDVVTKNDNNQLQIILNGIQPPRTQAVIARIKQQLAKQAPPDCRVRIETELLSAKRRQQFFLHNFPLRPKCDLFATVLSSACVK
ncbi:MAG: hypothetical protein GX167_06915 [Firmicutes bacterium]|nr:hypothetical protein [Bacillota bacterium]